jgi:hypothetical protein
VGEIALDTVVQSPGTEQISSQVFVDASGRRARRMTRCGYLLGMGCVGYIGMVALGLSGTRVAALPGVPTSADHEIIAGLSGEGGSIGLHLTPSPVAAGHPAPVRATEVHSAAVRAAAAHAATVTTRAALTHVRPSAIAPAIPVGAVTGRSAQPSPTGSSSGGDFEALAEAGAPADPTEAGESKSEKAAEKALAKRAKHSSGDKSY